MTRKIGHLDEFVRQATRLGDDGAAALADTTRQQMLFEEIIRVDTSNQPAVTRQSTRRRIQLAAVAAGCTVVVLALLLSTQVLGTPDGPSTVAASASPTNEPRQSPERQGDVFGTSLATSCVEEYSPQTLAGRAFAFEGTVIRIGERPTGDPGADAYVPVTFSVGRWFRGGSGNHATVAMFAPDVRTTADNASYAVGSRLLVSGEDRWGSSRVVDPIAWACGFTRWYNRVDADTWAQAFR